MSVLIASNPSANYNTNFYVDTSTYTGTSQSFTGDGSTIDNVNFWLQNVGSCDGTMTIAVYTQTGTYGTSSVPGSLLATSDSINASSAPGSFGWVNFVFSGANRIVLSNGTYYTLVLQRAGASSGDMTYGLSNQALHPISGNWAYYTAGSWVPLAYDHIFEAYGIAAGGGLFRPSLLAGLGAGGPFFQNPLG